MPDRFRNTTTVTIRTAELVAAPLNAADSELQLDVRPRRRRRRAWQRQRPQLRRHRPRTVVIFSQVFVPDPASVGQHIFDVAAELARRGFRVKVFTANRGYDDPSVVYPKFEVRDGVEIRRLPLSSFGKKSIFTRSRRHRQLHAPGDPARQLYGRSCGHPLQHLPTADRRGGDGHQDVSRRAAGILGDGSQSRPTHRHGQARQAPTGGAIPRERQPHDPQERRAGRCTRSLHG